MEIYRTLDELAQLDKPLHVAMGVFDGVHIGHRAVISEAVEAARESGGVAGVVTFAPNPIRVIAPGKAPAALLASLEHKVALMAEAGVEFVCVLEFDIRLAAYEPGEFLEKLCAAKVRTIAVGEDWRFGHMRRGDRVFLKEHESEFGYQLRAVPPVMFDGDRVSSTRIRQAIHDGNLAEASRMLGWEYSLWGVVAEGQKLGRELGFPTANIVVDDVQLPPSGVWAVRVQVDGVEYRGAANLGVRPTVGGGAKVLEVHLLDFEGELYGKLMEVKFDTRLRGESKFASLDELREQIAKDVAAVRGMVISG